MKTKDERPTESKHWLKLFDALCAYKHEPSRLLEDYLDMALCAVANQRLEERYLQVAKRYTRDELEQVSQLFAWHVLVHEHQTAPGADGRRGWYDMLGDIYMDLSGRSKAGRLGQFFTPESLCTMMAMITLEGVTPGKTVCDPCAGSGRLLLAAKCVAPDMGTAYAADVDGICVKMCALNFWLHGIRGEVAHMNSLSQEWYSAWHTHPHAGWPFVTFLNDARKEESHLWVARATVFEQQTVKQTAPLPPLDLFNQMSEPAEPYGDEEDPFRPCDLCGRVKGDTCLLLGEQVVEPWELRGTDDAQLVCMGCGVALRTSYPEPTEHRVDAAERKPLYGTAAKVHRYLENDRRATMERLQDLLVVLERHHAVAHTTGMDRWQRKAEEERAHQALWNNRERIAFELRLRSAELVHDSIRCRIGRMECTFVATNLPELIKSYRSNTKRAA